MNKVEKLRQKEANKHFKLPAGPLIEIDMSKINHPDWMTRSFKNNRYVVMINDNCPMTQCETAIRVMVQKHDGLPITNHWREMQNVKNEIFGKETVAIEYYPAESQLVDAKNVYWMFIFREGVIPLIK